MLCYLSYCKILLENVKQYCIWKECEEIIFKSNQMQTYVK